MSASMDQVVFNGKFLSAHMTGVHRVADELIVHLAKHSADSGEVYEILAPRDARRQLNPSPFKTRVSGFFTWQLWEQFDLPHLARGRTLVSLCNLAPLVSTNAITMIHDAQVYLTPSSYSRLFRMWYLFALPMIGRRSKKILTVSNFSKKQLVRFGVASSDKIEVIHNGVDHILRVTADKSVVGRLGLEKRKYVCALSNTQTHKNIPMLIKAFSDERLKDTPLVLIGGAGKEAFEKLGVPLSTNIIFAGRASDEELRALMENALCFAMPSKTEGFGLPPLESMLLGTPAVVAPEGALPEICGDGAIYADADDASAWGNVICDLKENPVLFARMSRNGVSQAKKYTWSGAAKKLASIITEVAGGQ